MNTHGGPEVHSEALREKCGVVAVYSPAGTALPDAYDALRALQHRGQDGSGFSYIEQTPHGDRLATIKQLGLIANAYIDINVHPIRNVGPQLAIAHVRYGTASTEDPYNALHPQIIEAGDQTMAIAQNGQLDMDALSKLAFSYDIESDGTDTEVLAKVLGQAVTRYGRIEPALRKILPELRGAFNLAILGNDAIYTVTDRHHVRPFVIGRHMSSLMVASEVGALHAAGFSHIGETQGGTFNVIEKDGMGIIRTERWAAEDRQSCLFELTYLSKAQNVIDGVQVGSYRRRAGAALAEQEDPDFRPDIVVPILGTAKAYAQGYSQELNVPYLEALKKNPLSNRTFIAATQVEREQAVADKFKLDYPEELTGKKVVLIDDSLVRGTTIQGIIRKIRSANPAEVHVRIGAEKVSDTCRLGVNIAQQSELFACNDDELEGVDSIRYLSLEAMITATGRSVDRFCHGCLGGTYPASTELAKASNSSYS